jgi:hypothetical protein
MQTASVDPRQSFMLLAAVKLDLVETGAQHIDEAFDDLIWPFEDIVGPMFETCDVCEEAPCAHPSFGAHCRTADEQRRREPPPKPKPRPTPQTSIEAVMWCIRERGIGALKEPKNVDRLNDFDAAARSQMNERIAKLDAAGRIPKRAGK